jgi:DNA modification methylase
MKKIKFDYLNKYTFGDSLSILKYMPDGCVDLVFTSLPDLSQQEKSLTLFSEWQRDICYEFMRVTKETGFIVISQTDRKVNGSVYSNHVNYIQTMSENKWMLKDEKIIVRNRVGNIDLYKFTYQYFSCFTKSGKIPTAKRKGIWLRDVIVDPESHVAHQYIWSQPFCRLVIETLTNPGDFVIDPFAGYGAVLYAAKTLKRNYWGGEIAKERYNKDFAYFESTFI